MITGFNTDIKVKNTVFHVQTEDRGRQAPRIETIVYHKGAILENRRISYEDVVNCKDLLPDVVRTLMEEQHAQTIEEVKAGQFLDLVAGAKKGGARKGPSLEEVIIKYLSERTKSA